MTLILTGVNIDAGNSTSWQYRACVTLSSSSHRRAAVKRAVFTFTRAEFILSSLYNSLFTMAGTLARKAVDHLRSKEFREYLMRSVTVFLMNAESY